MSADLQICEERDLKGIYVKAHVDEISDFTGVSAPYEPPEKTDFEVDTGKLSVEYSVEALVNYVTVRFPLTKN